MYMNKIADTIADLLRATGEAHHQAFIKVNGADPDWAQWYAAKLEPGLSGKLKAELSREEKAYMLPLLEKEWVLKAPEAEWSQYYARAIVERFGGKGTV